MVSIPLKKTKKNVVDKIWKEEDYSNDQKCLQKVNFSYMSIPRYANRQSQEKKITQN